MDHLGFDRLPDEALTRLYTLKPYLPFSPATLWRKIGTGEFPAPIKVSAGVTAWRVGSIREWLKDPAGYREPNLNDATSPPKAKTVRRGV